MVDDTTDKIKRLLEEAKVRERSLKRGSQRSMANVEIETEVPLTEEVDIVETVGGADIVEKVERETPERIQSGRSGQERQSSRPNHGDNDDNDAGENTGSQEGDGWQGNDGREDDNQDNGGKKDEQDNDDEEGRDEKEKERDDDKEKEGEENKDKKGGGKNDKDIADELEESKNRERAARNSGDKDGAGKEPQSEAGAESESGSGDNWDWKKAMQGDDNIARNVANYAKEKAKKKAKKEIKKLAKTAFKRFIWPVLIAIFGNPITWVVILAIFSFAVLISYCDSFFIRAGSKLVSIASPAPDFCSVFKDISGGNNVVNQYGASGTMFVDIPREYVSISNFGNSKSDYPRTKQSAAILVDTVFEQAKQTGLIDPAQKKNIVITSALRKSPPFALTCHVYGEAIDFVLVPAANNSDPRIDQLFNIVKNAGFGTVLDEYRNPTDYATGPHIHANLGPDPNCRGYTERPNENEYYMPY